MQNIFFHFLLFLLLLCIGITDCAVAENHPLTTPIPRGHAHNDYLHPRPLFDALDNGFCSVEADVFLVNGDLLVAHFFWQLRPGRTLESLYLDPLRERARQFNGKIFPDADAFYLWIELKTDAQKTYATLQKILEQYSDILTRYENNTVIPGAVTVVLTGNANLALIRNERVRYAGVDGRLGALRSNESADLIPTVSLDWVREFPQFRGELSPEQRTKLVGQVQQAHERGRKLRYWNAPDHEAFWSILYDADVDFINTNRLRPLRMFLTERSE